MPVLEFELSDGLSFAEEPMEPAAAVTCLYGITCLCSAHLAPAFYARGRIAGLRYGRPGFDIGTDRTTHRLPIGVGIRDCRTCYACSPASTAGQQARVHRPQALWYTSNTGNNYFPAPNLTSITLSPTP